MPEDVREHTSEEQPHPKHPHRRLLASYLREERPRAVGLAILLATLFAAVLGGMLGQRFHTKIDRTAL